MARNAILVEPQRIIPPLVASIVDGHRGLGMMVPIPELMAQQKENGGCWKMSLTMCWLIHWLATDSELISAGKTLLEQGADVLMLDCLGFHQQHRDLLQKALDVPVLLSNVLAARLCVRTAGLGRSTAQFRVTEAKHGLYIVFSYIFKRASSCFQSNEYFSGKVKSIGFTSSSTGRASVGVMAEGEYTFGTAQPEEMTVVSGALNVLLPGETVWKVYSAGDVFNVPRATVNSICRLRNRALISAAICKSCRRMTAPP